MFEAPGVDESALEERKWWPASTATRLEAAERRFTAAVARWDALAMAYTAIEIEELEAQLAEEEEAEL